MSWTREHIETMIGLQLKTQQLIHAAGTDAPGIDWLVEVNECFTHAIGLAELQHGRRAKLLATILSRRDEIQAARGGALLPPLEIVDPPESEART
jgi:hypothetical protein